MSCGQSYNPIYYTMENIKLAEVTINYRSKVKASDRLQVTCSKDAADYLRYVWSDTIEFLEEGYMLLLNRANRVLGYIRLSQGGTTGTVIDTKIVFQTALKCNAHAIIIAHNHPSGNLKPSDSDLQLTKKLKEAGTFMEIQLLDHLILGSEGYTSFADEGFI